MPYDGRGCKWTRAGQSGAYGPFSLRADFGKGREWDPLNRSKASAAACGL